MEERHITDEKLQKLLKAVRNKTGQFKNPVLGRMYVYAIEQKISNNNGNYLDFISRLEQCPVDIDTFIDDPNFLGSTDLVLWPEVRKAIININSNWWKGPEIAYKESLLMGASSSGKCVDGLTQFLTPNGWKNIKDYVEGDLVAQYGPDEFIEFIKPTRYIKQKNTTGFYKLHSRCVDINATPSHKIPYESVRSGKLSTVYMQDLVKEHKNTARGWRHKIISSFNVSVTTKVNLSDDQIRLMVYAIQYGVLCSDTGCCTVTAPNIEIKNRIKYLLDVLKLHGKEIEWGKGSFKVWFLPPQNQITYDGWWTASQSQLYIIRGEVLYGIGNEVKTFDEGISEYLQYVGASTGHTTLISTEYILFNKKSSLIKEQYTVKFNKNKYSSVSSKANRDVELDYHLDDTEYCFTVPTGMFLARCNNKIYVSGNSEICKVTMAYHLYILGCIRNPQNIYQLPSSTSIVFVIQAAKPHVSKRVIYTPLRKYIETMPWFVKHMRPDNIVESEMIFKDKNIRVVPGGTDSDNILGEAIIGAIVDEINYFNVVKNSKKAEVSTGRQGTYDQAANIYAALTKRKKSRFLYSGPQIGILMFSSQARHKNDFTEKRKTQIDELEEKNIYVYDKKQYEVWPQDRYSGEKFSIRVERSGASDIKVFRPEDIVPEKGNIIEVPIEYYEDFLKDPTGSLRDIVGQSLSAFNPLFRSPDRVWACVEKGKARGLKSFLERDNVILYDHGMPKVIEGHMCRDPSKKRYVHIDLSNTRDRCGLCMIKYEGMVTVDRFAEGSTERLPLVSVEMAVTIEPDYENEIDLAEVRVWVSRLKSRYGYPISAVSYDTYNSLESRQQWKKQGMKAKQLKVGSGSAMYMNLRQAIYDGRVLMYHQELLIDELLQLEFDEKKDKVDHPISFSNDCADSLCGAYNLLLHRSSTWKDATAKSTEMQGRSHELDRYDDDYRQ